MEEQKRTQESVVIFYSYAHKDEKLRKQLETHLSILRQQGVITEWHDRQIAAGTDWKQTIDAHLMNASVILLLISPDFLASDYCYSIEMKRAIERHEAGEARVIPILLRPTDWEGAPFAHLQYLPRNGKPVTSWSKRDEAFAEIAKSIRAVVKEIRSPSDNSPNLSTATPLPTALSSRQVGYLDRIVDSSTSSENTTTTHQKTNSIEHRSVKILAWSTNLLATGVLSIVLRFIPPLASIPLVNYVQQHQLPFLILVCGTVLCTLIGSLLFLRLTPYSSEQAPHRYLHSWGLLTGTSTVSFVLCFILLLVVLLRPPWCPMALCPPPQLLVNPYGVHDDNLEVYFQTIQSSSYFIPGDPASYTLDTLPMTTSALRIDTSTQKPYRVVLGIHSLQQGSFGLIIEQVILIVKQVTLTPYPLHVWVNGQTQDYHSNLYQTLYQGQETGARLLAAYTPLNGVLDGHVQLKPGESDELDIQVMSRVVADLHFQLQITYRVINEVKEQPISLPNPFEVIFTNSSNWHPYHIENGYLVTGA